MDHPTLLQDDATLWYTRCPIPTALSVALHTGGLDGLRVASLRHSPDPAVRLSHFTHTVPGQIRHGGHIPPLWARSTGRDVRLIGLSRANERQFLLVDRDSPLREVAELRGRRLALPVRPRLPVDFWRATVLRGYANALAGAGLTLDDVTLVEIAVDRDPAPARSSTLGGGVAHQTLTSQTEEARALLRGEVDAIFSPGHYGVALRHMTGARVLTDLAERADPLEKLNNFTLLAFTVEGGFLDRQPEAVTALLRASLAAAARAKADPAAAAAIVAAESGNPVDLVEEIFGADFADDLAPRLDDDLIEALERQGHFLSRHGVLPRDVPVEEWIDRAPLAAAGGRG